MKLNPNAIPFDFGFPEDNKPSLRYDLEMMLRLKSSNVRILPDMQKHEHSKHFIRPFSYPLPYMLSLKPKHQKTPTVIPPWFSMIYYNHYYPGTPLPVLPKTEEVRVTDGRNNERPERAERGRDSERSEKIRDSGDVRLADLRVEIPKPKWSLREAPTSHKKASPFKKHEQLPKAKRSQTKKHQEKQSSSIAVRDMELHRSDNRWQAQASNGEVEVAVKGITMILNKLSEENFDRLVKQTVAIPVSSFATLSVLAEHVFNKAIEEPNFAQLYARFCASLSELLPSFPDGTRTLDFRFTLLMLCHKYLVEQELDAERLQNVSPESKAEEELKLWNRRKGNIILIGQLFTKQLLAKPVIHNCVEMLLKADEEDEEVGEDMETAPPSDPDVECVCILLRTIGPLLDIQEDKDVSRGGREFNRMDGYFERIQSLSVHVSLTHRLRFMLRDLIELRQRNWDKPVSNGFPQGSPSGSPQKWRSKTIGGKPPSLSSTSSSTSSSTATRPKLNLQKPTHSRSNSTSSEFNLVPMQTSGHEKKGTDSRRNSFSSVAPPGMDRQNSCSSLPSTPRSQHKVVMLVKEYYSIRSLSEATQCITDCHSSHLASPQQKCSECETVFVEVVFQAVMLMFDGGVDLLQLCQTFLSNVKAQNTIQSEHLIAGLGRVLRLLPDVALDIPLAPTLMTSICSHLLKANDIVRSQLEAELAAAELECEGSTLSREVINRCFR